MYISASSSANEMKQFECAFKVVQRNLCELTLNADKIKMMNFSWSTRRADGGYQIVPLNNKVIEQVLTHTHLGFYFLQDKLSFKHHIVSCL